MNELVGQKMEDVLGRLNFNCRVIINTEGEAISSEEFKVKLMELMVEDNLDEINAITPHMFFVRNDGWVLSASPSLEETAFKMWKDEWAGFVKAPDKIVEAMESYVPGEVREGFDAL